MNDVQEYAGSVDGDVESFNIPVHRPWAPQCTASRTDGRTDNTRL